MKELLGKGAITEVHNPQGVLYSNLFLVPKKDGGQRPVINLKTEHIKMEGIHTLRDLVNPEDWLAKVYRSKVCVVQGLLLQPCSLRNYHLR